MNESMELFEQFNRVQWLLHRYHMINHREHGPMGDPHRGQGRVLTLLSMQPSITQRELGYLLNMRPQSLGELLAKLEKSGYIERGASEADKRVMDIHLTETGKQAAEQVNQGGEPALFGCLNDEEQQTLSDYLSRIIEALEAQLGDDQIPERGRGRGRFGFPFDPRFGGRPGFGPAEDDGEPRCHKCPRHCTVSEPLCDKFSPDRAENGGRHEGCRGGHGFDGWNGGPEGRGFGPDGMRRDGHFENLNHDSKNETEQV